MIFPGDVQPTKKIHINTHWKPLLLVACVFLFVGSIISMNDVLQPSLKDFFHLSYAQATYIQQSFFLVYLIFPIPIAYFISRFGYKKSVATALLITGFGGASMFPAFYFSSYSLALGSIFIISIGVAMVNVAANPLAALLGNPSGAHIRVNIVQLFARLGSLMTPIIGSGLIYGSGNTISFHLPYLGLGVGTFLFSIFILSSSIPSLRPNEPKGFSILSIFRSSIKYPQLIFGAIAMFFYMGAEVGTAGFFINYLRDNDISSFSIEKASRFLTYYYIASTLFCIAGIYLLQYVSPGKLIAVFGTGMIILYLLISLSVSELNPFYLIGIGALISVLFPTIFSLGIEGAGPFTEKGSAMINMAIFGGAVFPPLQGLLADSKGVQVSYLIPCFCCIVIVVYGIYCHNIVKMTNSINVE